MKYQSAKSEFINSQCLHGEESIKITQILKIIKDHFSKYNLIFMQHQYGVHWWINIFVKLKNNSYSMNKSYLLVTLDSMIGKNFNSILQVKNILQYFDDMKHINVQHLSLKSIPKQNDDYSCGVFFCLYSYCASLMINEGMSRDE